jgi:hypothetical protein
VRRDSVSPDGPQRAVDGLLAALHDESWDVLGSAAEALAKLASLLDDSLLKRTVQELRPSVWPDSRCKDALAQLTTQLDICSAPPLPFWRRAAWVFPLSLVVALAAIAGLASQELFTELFNLIRGPIASWVIAHSVPTILILAAIAIAISLLGLATDYIKSRLLTRTKD